jgi:PncC family amidohydrolase
VVWVQEYFNPCNSFDHHRYFSYVFHSFILVEHNCSRNARVQKRKQPHTMAPNFKPNAHLPLRRYPQGVAAAHHAFHSLQALGKTLALAESCTGGLIAALLTEIPGSSTLFRGGVCVYSIESKIALLGLDAELIARHNVVSQAVALAMAQGVRRLFGADLGIATTGIAGPGGGTKAIPVGTVCWAVSGEDIRGNAVDESFSEHFAGTRWQVRLATAWNIFEYIQGMA